MLDYYNNLPGFCAERVDDILDRHFGIDIKINNKSVQIKYEQSYNRYPNGNKKYTGNVAFELFSNYKNGILGGHLVTKAEYIIHLMADNVMLIFHTKPLKLFLLTLFNSNKYRKCLNKSINEKTKAKWSSQTVNIPFQTLLDLKLILKEVQI